MTGAALKPNHGAPAARAPPRLMPPWLRSLGTAGWGQAPRPAVLPASPALLGAESPAGADLGQRRLCHGSGLLQSSGDASASQTPASGLPTRAAAPSTACASGLDLPCVKLAVRVVAEVF